MSTELADRILLAKRKNKLQWYETEIDKRGRSLAQIFKELRDDPDKPYLATHANFEDYCRDRWNMTPRRSQQLVAAQNVRQLIADSDPDLAPIVEKLPERALRELTSTPPEKRADVLRNATSTPGKLTAKKIAESKVRIVDPPEPEPIGAGISRAMQQQRDPRGEAAGPTQSCPKPEGAPNATPGTQICPHCKQPI